MHPDYEAYVAARLRAQRAQLFWAIIRANYSSKEYYDLMRWASLMDEEK